MKLKSIGGAAKRDEPVSKRNTQRLDVDSTESQQRGLAGAAEGFLRRFRSLSHALLMAPLYLFGAGLMGVGLWPGLVLIAWVWNQTPSYELPLRLLFLGMSLGTAFFLFGFTLIFVLPVANWLLVGRLKPWRGPYYSLASIRWYIHNGATYLLRYTFLEFVTPSPFNLLFFRLMGMRIGRGTIINTSYISDPSLIEIGEKVTIGGSATLLAHYGVGGFLVLSPVKIGNRVTIGLKASVMGGVEIGDDSLILPHSVVLPKTVIPPGEIWGGVPAVRVGSNRK